MKKGPFEKFRTFNEKFGTSRERFGTFHEKSGALFLTPKKGNNIILPERIYNISLAIQAQASASARAW